MSKRTAIVECTVRVEVELPDDPDYDPRVDIEERHCPGTGVVGTALREAIEKAEKRGTCWACPGGRSKVVEIREVT